MEYNQQNGSNGDKGDEDERKVFVGGLSWQSTERDMRTYFEKFGAVEKAILKTDSMTGESRGFGFILFEEASSVEVVMAEQTHSLNGKKIGPRRAKSRPKPEPILKVFVGGLDPSVPEEDIKAHFEHYGTVEEINLPFDRTANERRKFCFVKFESEEIVNSVIAANNSNGKQVIGGKEVDVKKHTPKDQYGRGGRGRGFGGRGRGRGGFGGYGGYYDDYYGGYGGYGGGYSDYSQDYYGGGGGGYDYYGGYGGYGKGPRGQSRGRGRGYSQY